VLRSWQLTLLAGLLAAFPSASPAQTAATQAPSQAKKPSNPPGGPPAPQSTHFPILLLAFGPTSSTSSTAGAPSSEPEVRLPALPEVEQLRFDYARLGPNGAGIAGLADKRGEWRLYKVRH